MNSRMLRTCSVAVTLGVATFALGCGGDDTTTTPKDAGHDVVTDTSSGDTSMTTAVVVNATYTGSARGPLLAAAFATPDVPPLPGANPVAIGQNTMPMWPGTNSLTFMNFPAPGTYYAFGYIMVGQMHIMGPLPGDAIWPNATPITVINGQTTMVNVTMTDFMVPDSGPGDSGGDAPADTGSGSDAGGDAPTD